MITTRCAESLLESKFTGTVQRQVVLCVRSVPPLIFRRISF